MTQISKKSVVLILISMVAATFLCIMEPTSLSGVLKMNYRVDLICLFLLTIVFIYIADKDSTGIFSPIFLFSMVYIIMFFVTPIYDIWNDNTSVFGVTDLFDYGVKSSFYALLGYFSFALCYGYYSHKKAVRTDLCAEGVYYHVHNIAQLALLGWLSAFLLEIILIIFTKGYSLRYILTLGFGGSNSTSYEYSNSFLGFIEQATRSVIPFYLLYFHFAKGKMMKVFMMLGTCIIFMISGFRYLAVVFLLSVFFFYYINKKKKPHMITVIGMVVLLLLLVSAVGFIRGSMRRGAGSSLDGFQLADILQTVMDNFGIYKSYYAVVKAVPDLTNYIYADQMIIYTLILFIPRLIWRNKPGNPGTAAQLYGLNQAAVSSGYAYPCLGEYYYSFGLLGIIICLGIFGRCLSAVKVKYRDQTQDPVDYMIYSIYVTVVFQLIIRGYTPTNFYLVLVLVLPLYWFKRFGIKIQEK